MPNPEGVSRNLITDYYARLPAVIARCVADAAPVKEDGNFSPGFLLPDLDDAVARFFSVATASWRELGSYEGRQISLLDLTQNPQTGTTKTFASLLIVARAVEYIRRTGEPIMIFSPTSANKGVALRDAVGRAIEAGLVTAAQLRMVMLAPASCRAKMRDDRLAATAELRRLNPVLLYGGGLPEHVKALGKQLVEGYAKRVSGELGAHLWYSLDLPNYLIADGARAFLEADVSPTGENRPRLHAHSVSSAFGLLGYNVGRDVLEASGQAQASDRPGFLLVQHLGTPDMVLSLRFGSFDRENLPGYAFDSGSELYGQETDPHFPVVCADPQEVLDPTFYTHRPVTSPAMNELIATYGGDGIVVSRQECLNRYELLRRWIPQTPAAPAELREWSLAMAVTGVTNAIDRGLVEADRDVVIHGTGSYAAGGYEPLAEHTAISVATVSEIATVLLGSA